MDFVVLKNTGEFFREVLGLQKNQQKVQSSHMLCPLSPQFALSLTSCITMVHVIIDGPILITLRNVDLQVAQSER